jgi:general L-amino acid transport system substrate-binding protein
MNHWRFCLFPLLLTLLTACEQEQPTTSTSSATNNGSRLETVKSRGKLICGINGEVPGFSFVNEKGDYSGIDVDICRAIAAALFDNPAKVEYRKLSPQERFTAVQTGEVDILSRNTSLTLSRDTALGIEFVQPIFYDGQGIMVKKSSNIQKLADLQGKSICVLSGTTTAQNLTDAMSRIGIKDYKPIVSDDVDSLYTAYQAGRCEAVTSDRSQLVARRSVFPKPDDHQVLEEVMSKEPLAPAVAAGDAAWSGAVKWIIYSLIQGEEFGITSQNIPTFANSKDPSIRRFLGIDEKLGEDMGVPNDFAARAIEHVGNYGEIYDRSLVRPLGLERGLNNLWTKGGLLYSPPFR